MQDMHDEAQKLLNQPARPNSTNTERLSLLERLTQTLLPGQAKWESQGLLVTVTLSHATPTAIAAWLEAVRQQTPWHVAQAELQRTGSDWQGRVVLQATEQTP